MKRCQLILILGFLLIASNGFAAVLVDSLIVSGSNDPLVNGTYTYAGMYESKMSWTKGDYVLRWSEAVMGFSWNIENTSTSGVYYGNWSNTWVPEETGWQSVAQAVLPYTPPVVTQTALPESLIVSGTVDSFLNGVYTRGLNYKGYPQYAMGDYAIRQGWEFMSIDWNIVNIATHNQYYTHTGIGVNVPEQGWNLSSSAGSPSSPPVITETELPSQYRVSGAGFSEVDGIYTRLINSTSHTGLVYEKEEGYFLRAGGVGPMVLGYGITNSGGGSYYYVESNSLIIPTTGWALDYLGTSYPPPPFVAPYNFPWPMFLPAVTK